MPTPYDDTARRKIMPETLEQRVLAAFREHRGGPLFRKTSCAVSYAHGLPDYNGHVGIRELCDICPASQLALCLDGQSSGQPNTPGRPDEPQEPASTAPAPSRP